MLPAPATLLEAALWDAHAALLEARASGRAISEADAEVKSLLASYIGSGPEHVSAVRAFLIRLDEELAHFESERARAIAQTEEAGADRMRFRAHTLNALKASGATGARAQRGQITLARGKRSIEIRDVGRLPEAFVQVLPAQRVAREKEIRAAIEQGEAVPGALLVEGELHLVVR